MNLVRKFEFDAAHRLTKGKVTPCHQIHGHRYVCEIRLKSLSLDHLDMVLNFSTVKSLFITPILELLDHSIILNRDDPSGIIELCQRNDFRMLLLEQDPTAEVLTLWMQKFIVDRIESIKKLPSFKVGITCFETPNCWVII